MGFFTKFFNRRDVPTTVQAQFLNNGLVTWQGVDAQQQVRQAYAGNDIVYSCIKLITEKAKLPEWNVYKIVDEKKFKQYKAAIAQPDKIQDWKQLGELKELALERVKHSKWDELLKYPNEDQTFTDLVEYATMFKLITGNSYTYAKLIEAGANGGKPNSLHVLPAQFMSVIASIAEIPVTAVGYQMMIGNLIRFDRTEIMHDKFANPDWDVSGKQLYGLSPLTAAAKVVTRSNEGKQFAVSSYQNGGPTGVLFVKKDQGFTGQDLSAQAELIKSRLQEYRGSINANKTPISGIEIGYQPIGLSPIDMDILNAELFDLRAICNIYGVPSQLLNDPDNKKFNNQLEGEKSLTTRGAIPLLTSFRDNLNRKIQTDWGQEKGLYIDYDLHCFPELQDDKLKQVQWLEKSLLPLERRYEILGEVVPEWMDEATRRTILMPSGYQPIDEPNINADDPYGKV